MSAARYLLLAFLVGSAAVTLLAAPGGAADTPAALPPLPPEGSTSPEADLRRFAHFLAGLPEKDRCFVRALDYHAIPERLWAEHKPLYAWWWNQMSLNQLAAQQRPVPGTNGRLEWIDLRDFGWQYGESWWAVAELEPYTRQPWISDSVGRYLRRTVKSDYEQPGKDGTLPVVAAVRADWLFRETIEAQRSRAYYALLYAKFRVGDPKFPRTLQDVEKVFGVDLTLGFGREKGVANLFGAVVKGGRDDPRRGSIVALNNRLIVVAPEAVSAGSAAYYTFDVFAGTGKRNYVQQLAELPYLAADRGNLDFDVGEALFTLPNGGQAGALFDRQFKLVDLAAQQAADGRRASPDRLSPGVRNPGDCVVCHAPGGGFNTPDNVAKRLIEDGVDVQYHNGRESRNLFIGFYLSWESRVPGWTAPYRALLAASTKARPPAAADWEAARKAGDAARLAALTAEAARAKNDPGWNGAELKTRFLEAREWYDGPIELEQQARELGVPVELYRRLLAKSVAVELAWAERGEPIPRAAWEKDHFRTVGLLLDAFRREKH